MLSSRLYFQLALHHGLKFRCASHSVSLSRYLHHEQKPHETDLKEASAEHQLSDQERYRQRVQKPKISPLKSRRSKLFGGFFIVFFSVEVYMMWKRRNTYYKMNEKIPPITFEEFKEQYLKRGTVDKIVCTPSFGVLDVFLNKLTSEEEIQKKRWKFLAKYSPNLHRLALDPDLRVNFKGKSNELEKHILELHSQMDNSSLIKIENGDHNTLGQIAIAFATAFLSVAFMAIATS